MKLWLFQVLNVTVNIQVYSQLDQVIDLYALCTEFVFCVGYAGTFDFAGAYEETTTIRRGNTRNRTFVAIDAKVCQQFSEQ